MPEDNFSRQSESAEEKRLHLRAFDYWHSLRHGRPIPLFSSLTPEGLAPYRSNTLLLEFTEAGALVRYIGDRIGILIDAPIAKGTDLADFPRSTFAQALLARFKDQDERSRAAEFEFVEDLLDCRGIMLPLSRDGEGVQFVMVVTNFRRRAGVEHGEGFDLAERLADCERAARQVVHYDGDRRGGLYDALAKALALYEEGHKNPEAYGALLARAGLKAQARAPFTPALKLTFGKDFDKTRLTEYGAALAHAVANGQTPDSVAAFIADFPGGIKGCVQAHREGRRTKGGAGRSRRDMAAEQAAKAPALPAKTIDIDEEFGLVLARKNPKGGVDLLAPVDLGQGALGRALAGFVKEP